MKKIEVVAVVLIVLWFLTLFPNFIFTYIVGRICSTDELVTLRWTLMGMLVAHTIVSMLVHFGVGVWLFIQAKQDKAIPWVWGLFGLTFGISAAILYFLMYLIKEMKIKRTAE